MLAIGNGSGEVVTRALSNSNGSGGELVEAGAELVAEKESEVEGEEASDGLGWKFGKKSMTNSLNEGTCLVCCAGPIHRNHDSTAPSAQASARGLEKESNLTNGQSPGRIGVVRKRAM